MQVQLPKRFEFNRPAGAAQFLRALLLIVIGGALAAAALNLDRFVSLPPGSALPRIILIIALVVALSGLIALPLLLAAQRVYKPMVIEVDAKGLRYLREGRAAQNVRWDEVAAYEQEVGGLINLNDLFTMNSSSIGSHSNYDAGGEAFGCLFGLVFGLYFLVLESIIGTGSWKVKFRMESKRAVHIFGYGAQMDELVQKILPQALPGKLKGAAPLEENNAS